MVSCYCDQLWCARAVPEHRRAKAEQITEVDISIWCLSARECATSGHFFCLCLIKLPLYWNKLLTLKLFSLASGSCCLFGTVFFFFCIIFKLFKSGYHARFVLCFREVQLCNSSKNLKNVPYTHLWKSGMIQTLVGAALTNELRTESITGCTWLLYNIVLCEVTFKFFFFLVHIFWDLKLPIKCFSLTHLYSFKISWHLFFEKLRCWSLQRHPLKKFLHIRRCPTT